MGLQFILLIALFVIPRNEQVLQNAAWLETLGLVFLIPGVFILALSSLGLGSALTASPIPKENSTLVKSGMYGYVRHPIYTGLLILGLAPTLHGGVFPQFLVWLGLLLLLNYKARFEEKLLLRKYPEYVEYVSKTGRFIPRLKG